MRPARYRKRFKDISENEKEEIFTEYENSGVKLSILSENHNISIQNISRIISGKLKEKFKKEL